MERVLVGCPTYDGKKYALAEFKAGIDRLTYTDRNVLLVDNSADDSYLEHLKAQGIAAIKGIQKPTVAEQIAANRNILREKALSGWYDALLSLEQDVVPPPDVI